MPCGGATSRDTIACILRDGKISLLDLAGAHRFDGVLEWGDLDGWQSTYHDVVDEPVACLFRNLAVLAQVYLNLAPGPLAGSVTSMVWMNLSLVSSGTGASSCRILPAVAPLMKALSGTGRVPAAGTDACVNGLVTLTAQYAANAAPELVEASPYVSASSVRLTKT